MNKCLSFDDVLLMPQYSDIRSRSEVDTSIMLGEEIFLHLPIVTSPMDTVTEERMAIEIGKLGGLGVVHRYNDIPTQASMIKKTVENVPANVPVAAAIGITGDFEERAAELVRAGASVLCLDVAHGDHVLMRDALLQLKNAHADSVHFMAGNVASKAGFERLCEWGANSVRIGIGGGSICSTRIQTGHGVPTLQSIIDCAEVGDKYNVKLIADGGIKNSGDIVKAIAAGAHMVMVGSLVAGTTETPGQVINGNNSECYKVYRGMASREAQIKWRGKTSSLEGVSAFVPCRGDVRKVIDELVVGLRSGMSYSGAKSIAELHNNAVFIRQTGAGFHESTTHILKR